VGLLGIFLIATVLAVAACQLDGQAVPATEVVSPATCAARGGEIWTTFLSPAPFCKILPTDMGKACTRSTDCEDSCKAESKTCGVTRYDAATVLDADGKPVAGAIQ
jgi:hypothetical protein